MEQQPRAVIYGTYADECKAQLEHARQAYLTIALTADMSETETAKTLTEIIGSWRDPAEVLAPLESAVRNKGTDSVAASALAATRALELFGTLILQAARAQPEVREREIQSAKNAFGSIYRTYIEFLYDASVCLQNDDFLRTRS
ncbi:hypothetical protein ACWF2L_13330 [Streptomyces anulatus]